MRKILSRPFKGNFELPRFGSSLYNARREDDDYPKGREGGLEVKRQCINIDTIIPSTELVVPLINLASVWILGASWEYVREIYTFG